MNIIRLIIFTLLVPGFVVVYVPYSIYNQTQMMDIGIFRYFGLPIIPIGFLLYLWSAINFLLQGKGTPAIWLTKRLEFLIGTEPVKLVSKGLYRYSRNPMYLGVVGMVYGISIYFESISTLIYALGISIFFHLVIVYIEEPHLKRKYGQEFESYLQETNRWLGRKSNSN